jgi:hypothetical protein
VQEQVQAGEGQLGLGLDAGPAQHPHPACAPSRVVQQRGLADPGLTPDDQRTADPVPSRVEEGVDPLLLGATTPQHAGNPIDRSTDTDADSRPAAPA